MKQVKINFFLLLSFALNPFLIFVLCVSLTVSGTCEQYVYVQKWVHLSFLLLSKQCHYKIYWPACLHVLERDQVQRSYLMLISRFFFVLLFHTWYLFFFPMHTSTCLCKLENYKKIKKCDHVCVKFPHLYNWRFLIMHKICKSMGIVVHSSENFGGSGEQWKFSNIWNRHQKNLTGSVYWNS